MPTPKITQKSYKYSRDSEADLGLPLTIITKHSILDVAAALDPPLGLSFLNFSIILLVWVSINLGIERSSSKQ